MALRVWHLVRAAQRAESKAQLLPGAAVDAKPDGSHQTAPAIASKPPRRCSKPAAGKGESVPTLKEVIRTIQPRPGRPAGPPRTLHGRKAKPGAKHPSFEPPPPRPAPEQVDRTLAKWTRAREAGDVGKAWRLLEELRELAERP